MEIIMIVIIVGFAGVAAILFYGISIILKRQREDQTSLLLQQQIDALREQVRLSLEGEFQCRKHTDGTVLIQPLKPAEPDSLPGQSEIKPS